MPFSGPHSILRDILPVHPALSAVSALILMACATPGTVRIPAHDATRPWAALDVVGADRIQILMEGGEPGMVELAARDSVVLIALGGDGDGGIKDISLSGNAIVTCREAGTGRSKSRSAAFARRQVGSASANPRAPAQKSARYILRGSDFLDLCPGSDLLAVVGQATARTVNFHGGASASPRVEFRLEMPEPADTSALERLPPAETPRQRNAAPALPDPARPARIPGPVAPEDMPYPLRRSTSVSPQATPKTQFHPKNPASRI